MLTIRTLQCRRDAVIGASRRALTRVHHWLFSVLTVCPSIQRPRRTKNRPLIAGRRPAAAARPPLSAVAGMGWAGRRVSPDSGASLAARRRRCLLPDHLRPFDCRARLMAFHPRRPPFSLTLRVARLISASCQHVAN